MIDDDRELHRLMRQTTRNLVEETARLQARPYRHVIVMAAICLVLGLAIAIFMTWVGRVL